MTFPYTVCEYCLIYCNLKANSWYSSENLLSDTSNITSVFKVLKVCKWFGWNNLVGAVITYAPLYSILNCFFGFFYVPSSPWEQPQLFLKERATWWYNRSSYMPFIVLQLCLIIDGSILPLCCCPFTLLFLSAPDNLFLWHQDQRICLSSRKKEGRQVQIQFQPGVRDTVSNRIVIWVFCRTSTVRIHHFSLSICDAYTFFSFWLVWSPFGSFFRAWSVLSFD